jgi:hypothetical protein
MQRLMKELGETINAAITDSDPISRMLTRIKEEGYDVYLVLEATADDQGQSQDVSSSTSELVPMKREHHASPWHVTAHDARFLKSLHIQVEEPRS